MNELISVIIPVYNASLYLKQCIDSVINQTYRNLEIICVNDGSTDNSLEILREYEKADKRVVIVDKINEGVSIARNSGLEAANGEYIMFVDSDDWVDEDICEKMISAVKKSNADAGMCCYIREFGTHSLINRLFEGDMLFSKEEYNDFLYKLIGITDYDLNHPECSDVLVSPWMQLFRADIIGNTRFEDIRNIGTSEDWLFQIEIYCKCSTVIYVDIPMYHYRKTNNDSITAKYKKNLFEQWQRLYDEVFRIVDKHGFLNEYTNHIINNKIAVSLLFLGLNEIKSDKALKEKARNLKYMRDTDRYQKAYSEMTLKYMPIHWKMFFLLCKYKCMTAVVCMLYVIEYLRKNRK